MKRALRLLAAGATAFLAAGAALSQTVVLSGVLGSKALLVINGGAPKSVAPGETHQGVKVVSTQPDQATVEIAGERLTLRLGEAPVSSGGSMDGSESRRIVLHAGSNGHFKAPGQINGRAVTFIVDTGASAVSLGEAEARSIGLNYQSGQRVPVNTANGQSIGWLVKLSSVRLGNVDTHEVDALVTPAPMPYVLLGNSYLTRFQMTRTNDQLVLEKRY